jgi:hypothetical protein
MLGIPLVIGIMFFSRDRRKLEMLQNPNMF